MKLRSISLFSCLSDDVLRRLDAKMHWRVLEEQEEVFDKDSTSLEIYFLISGRCRVLSPGPNDREVVFANIEAGDYFGELAAIDGEKRSARVLAIEHSEVSSLPRSDFVDILRTNSEIAFSVLLRFAGIIRQLDGRLSDFSVRTENQRIISELLRLAAQDDEVKGTYRIPDLPNHSELAGWAGTTRQAVAQTIGELIRMRIIERRGLSLIIHDMRRLRELTGHRT